MTDGSGNLDLWLFLMPPDPGTGDPIPAYSLNAVPLGTSGFDPIGVQGVTLSDNATLVVVLGTSHSAPVTTLDISPTANGDGTFNEPATITLSAMVAGGFVLDASFYTVDGGPQQDFGPFQVSGGGPHAIWYFSSDSGGVVESPKVFNFIITVPDAIAPTTTATVVPPANGAGWNATNVTVSLSAVDNPGGSGVAQITFSISGAQATAATTVAGDTVAIPITVEGVSIVTFSATDNAGNVETAKTVTVRVDKTAPTISAVRTPAPNANGWNNVPVTVTFVCADALSGLAAGSPPAPVTLTADGAAQSVTGTCTDNAGNSATTTLNGINIDRTAPEVYTQFDPSSHDVLLFGRDSLSGVPAGPIAPISVVQVNVHEHDNDHGGDQGHGDGHGEGHDDGHGHRDGHDCVTEIRTYVVTDRAGNTLRLVATVRKSQDDLTMHIDSLRYGSGAVLALPTNTQTLEWDLRSNGTLKDLDQDFSITSGSPISRVDADFDSTANTTTIVRIQPMPRVTVVRPGVALLRMATSAGTLSIQDERKTKRLQARPDLVSPAVRRSRAAFNSPRG